MFTIINNKSKVKFNVKILNKGDQYGLNKCLRHDEEEPVVEFYDARHKNSDPEGQFISRYYVKTLLGMDDELLSEDITLGQRGLCLDGNHSDTWYLTPENCMCVGTWIRSELGYF
ncbi:hypothetical protein Ga0123462_1123 [Mariprofundus ferrinatatus]|uniref:Uncharacterized protein n=1 Tax=Mariprofundus ferrinatatus TaxID=1921087 RepID=A0A2K8L3X0_9PROT|nr:hypothetical protein [Mariprofundus ferrinatatus]ATX81987.1 hypothetical protein Ga0123462_1123 [Mariprofundus ferrinatatus]